MFFDQKSWFLRMICITVCYAYGYAYRKKPLKTIKKWSKNHKNKVFMFFTTFDMFLRFFTLFSVFETHLQGKWVVSNTVKIVVF